MWSLLIQQLHLNHSALSPSDRASLLDDAFALAGASLLPYDTLMELCKYLEKETHYIPWATFSNKICEPSGRGVVFESIGNK